MSVEPTIRYYPDTDTMAIEVRPCPGDGQRGGGEGGEDAGPCIPSTSRRR